MKDKDSHLIYEAYLTEEEPTNTPSSIFSADKQNILQRLKELEDLLPDGARVQWKIENGQFSGVTPYALGNGNKPEDNSINALKQFLSNVFENEELAQKHGLAGATYHGYNDEPFWIANDADPRDAFGQESMNPRGGAAEEFKDQYHQFRVDKMGTEAHAKSVLNGKNPPPVAKDVSKASYEHQNDWRIVLYAQSEDISKVGAKTVDDVGYGKGRYMGD